MKLNKIYFNSFDSKTELCELGVKYGTDKTPFLTYDAYNLDGITTALPYTPFYNLLFSSMKYKNIIFGEIGIYKNASMKMWREYFPNATLYGWDCDNTGGKTEDRYSQDFVELARKDNLDNTFYDYMNVKDESSIVNSFKKTNTKFDIIIDDSDHEFWSQIRIIRSSVNFLSSNGMLIIEDVWDSSMIELYEQEINRYGHQKFYNSLTHISPDHDKKTYSGGLLLLTRNEVNQ